MDKPLLSAADCYQMIHRNRLGEALLRHASDNFKWGEVFNNCTAGEVFAAPLLIYENAVKQAALMERVRALFGKPITVRSWYRDPEHNRREGGATHSQHLKGLATDFVVMEFEGKAGCLKAQKILDSQPWMKNCGLEWTSGDWIHSDSRSEEDGKLYGYRFHV